MSATRAALVSIAFVAAGCGRDRTSSGTPSFVRDSAGITVVDNVSPMLGTGAWRLSDSARTVIGGMEAGAGQELFRVVGAIRLADGRIVIGNAGSSELKFFSADGQYLHAVGKPGDGPGEFAQLAAVRRYRSDSIVTWDGQQGRVSIYDGDGTLGRVASLERRDAGALFLLSAFGVFDDGSFFISALNPFGAAPTSGESRVMEPVWRFSATGARLDSIGAFPGREMYVEAVNGGVRATSRLFGRSTSYAAFGEHVYAGTNDRFAIARFAATGALEMLVRVAAAQQPVGRGDRDALINSRMEQLTPEQQRQYRQRYEGNEPPPTYPAYRDIAADAAGNLWVRNYTRPSDEDARLSVFDPDGRWVTVVDVPDDLQVLEIGVDYLLGVWTDELGVEYVRLYGINR